MTLEALTWATMPPARRTRASERAVRAETEQECWSDRIMVIQAKEHAENPESWCERKAE